jgi:protoheme ferro-lyase
MDLLVLDNQNTTDRVPLLTPTGADRHQHTHLGVSSALDAPTSNNLPEILRAQAAALRRSLTKGWQVFAAVHGDSPSISEALTQINDAGIERLIVIPMHPQFSPALGAAQLDELYACLRRMQLDLHIEVRASWHDDSAFIDATTSRLYAFATARSLSPCNTVLIFQARAAQGDKYRQQVAATAELLCARLGWPQNLTTVIFGDTTSGLDDLSDQTDSLDPGASRSVLICPISDLSRRPCEHSVCEAAYRAVLGTRAVHLAPAANDSEEFIRALTQLVRRPRHSAYDLAEQPAPLFPAVDVSEEVARELGSFFMLGVEVRGNLGPGQGPALHFTSPQDFRSIKRPHLETIDLLRHAAQCSDVRECMIWNTCTRFELYGWLPDDPSSSPKTLERLAALAFPTADPRRINLLTGADARRHMLRTAAGLNSHLIGDAEVIDQLDACRRAAEHARTASTLTNNLVDDAIEAIHQLRQDTAWSNYDNRYCATVLSRLADRLATPMRGQILVIGGSTTSCSILETLIKNFRIPRERLSLIYRGRRKGALVRRLHNATGEGQVTIVESYTDPIVLAAIARNDLVFLGIDQREPIASTHDLTACRDLASRPLTVLDFNTFGSLTPSPPRGGPGRGGPESLSTAHGFTLLTSSEIHSTIDTFNSQAISDPDFSKALAAAEAWITDHAHPLTPSPSHPLIEEFAK